VDSTPKTRGSASVKVVMPAVTGRGYDDLENAADDASNGVI